MKIIKKSFFYNNGLSIVLLLLMCIFLTGQFISGMNEKNKERLENKHPSLTVSEYFQSGHFIQATFENWESEFLQMTLFILLTVCLKQKGSSESKKLHGKEEVDRFPKPHTNAPFPVKKGGLWLTIYSHSLSISFSLLFFLSFIAHMYGSMKSYNEEQIEKMLPTTTWNEYIGMSRFWFESFQNWQSEFVAVASIVLLSIWLREKGSPQSKPVDSPHGKES